MVFKVLTLKEFCNFPSNPSCTDIMEIYNAVEEMDDDEEVNLDYLAALITLLKIKCCVLTVGHHCTLLGA